PHGRLDPLVVFHCEDAHSHRGIMPAGGLVRAPFRPPGARNVPIGKNGLGGAGVGSMAEKRQAVASVATGDKPSRPGLALYFWSAPPAVSGGRGVLPANQGAGSTQSEQRPTMAKWRRSSWKPN